MTVGNISETQSFDLYQTAKETLSRTNTVTYLPLEEYDLIAQGVSKKDLDDPNPSDSLLSTLASITSCRYLAFVDVVDRFHRDFEDVNEAKILFQVVDTKGGIFVSKFEVSTAIGPLEIPDEDNDPVRLNLTGTSTAVYKAFRKGFKKIRKGVVSM